MIYNTKIEFRDGNTVLHTATRLLRDRWRRGVENKAMAVAETEFPELLNRSSLVRITTESVDLNHPRQTLSWILTGNPSNG